MKISWLLVLLVLISIGLGIQPINEWNATIDFPCSTETTRAQAIAVDSNNNVIVAGYSNCGLVPDEKTGTPTWTSLSVYAGFIIKYDNSGNELWNTTFYLESSNFSFYDVATGSDDAIVAVGRGYDASTGDMDGYIVKYDVNGNPLWNATVPSSVTPHNNKLFGVTVASDINDTIFAAGEFDNGSGHVEPGIIKYNYSGSLLSRTNYNFSGLFLDIDNDSQDNLITYGYVLPSPEKAGVFKYNNSMDPLWNVTISSYSNTQRGTITYNDVIVMGYYDYNSTEENYYFRTIRFDSNGNQLSNSTYNCSTEPYLDETYGAVFTFDLGSNRNYSAIGFTKNNTNHDAVLMYYNSSFGQEWNYTYDTGSDDYFLATNVDYNNDVIMAATSGSITKILKLSTPDVTPPVISNVQAVNVTEHNATIIWNTNEQANSSVKYGVNASNLSLTAYDSSLVLNHSITLTNLSKGTTYYYNVTSCDSSGNCAEAGPYSFTTFDIMLIKTVVTSPEPVTSYLIVLVAVVIASIILSRK